MAEDIRFTSAEEEVLDLLGQATNKFCALRSYHENDKDEWVRDMHHLQHRIMKRVAVRMHPEIFAAEQLLAMGDKDYYRH